jgi:hypothetical protein
MDEAEVAAGGLLVSGCKATGVFQLVEAALCHNGQRVNCGIEGELDQAVPLGLDYRHAATVFHALINEINVGALSLSSALGAGP